MDTVARQQILTLIRYKHFGSCLATVAMVSKFLEVWVVA